MFDDIVLIIASIGILLASFRLWVEKDREKMVYARLHITGVIDIACIVILLVFRQYLLALTYLVLVPFSAHAIANADYFDELKKQ
ncbi:membrane-bound hydrogenase subunit ehbC [Methanococcus maripaludis C5]|uniref:Energy-converting hydrogenase B subunit C n=3 Tax=Methanococcus maripaludis TaxID=39152 RepID=A0A2L1CCR2_METMI|nr:cation:proton antiporter [Methanococcus maripaludis]ABO34830.1 membrane-bound hydrogenase subunit ehbC [Methanococcus maripaludis C5]AVB77147.1 putative monovalent cation/H+ antiporter subunit G [Methanococcus maripaludis]MBA2840145.1 energy-converting hydrogenase B subunit C [Methanococcus maripaludis]MBA2863658.1 energy-converting hydrogenase B subunit C [Methanococcus maripaludis]MBA2868499.1 energy-converting hydrogenase B subunit C [Methanococcus maripaludis]